MFRTLAQERTKSLTPDADTAALQSSLFGFAERLEIDSAGRIILPKLQLEWTGLKTEVALVGAGDWLEIHDLNTWMATAQDRFKNLQTLADKVEGRHQLRITS